jgi:Na+-driven multidrug efflux pump
MASWIGLVRIVSGFGAAAVAGYTIGVRVIIFGLLPSWGLANAAATMVGQSLGAGHPDRAKLAVRLAGWFNLGVLGLVGALFVGFAPWIVHLFTADPVVAGTAIACLRLISAGFAFYGWGMVFTAAFNGAGDSWTPTWINLLCFWVWELPLAWVLARPLGWGPNGAFAAVGIAFSTLAVVSGMVFRRGTWAMSKV